jgi:hypothetical protein
MESIRIFSKVARSICIEEANSVEHDGQSKLKTSSSGDPTRALSASRGPEGQPPSRESAAAGPRMTPTCYVGTG